MNIPNDKINQLNLKQRLSPSEIRILIIDDHPDLLLLNKIVLEMDHYQVLAASNGYEALALLDDSAPPQLILLDVQMEEMSGPEFLKILEERHPKMAKNIPIIFLTGRNTVPKSIALGFISKPIDTQKLLKIVRHVLRTGTLQGQHHHH